MMSFGNLPSTLGAFVVALAVLIVVHEYGHYLAARLCGVKVLRFSVGFGRPLWIRRMGPDATEWVIALFPLGGFVKMLDEREGDVSPAEAHRAFNRQSLGRRSLIVAAGPAANFLLAIVLYWVLFIHGVPDLRPVLGAPAQNSAAARAEVQEGEVVRSISGKAVATWSEMRWEAMHRVLDRQPIVLEVINPKGEIAVRRIASDELDQAAADGDPLPKLGLVLFRPLLPPVVGTVVAGSPAERAGFMAGDEIAAIDGVRVHGWTDAAGRIRQVTGRAIEIDLLRDGRSVSLQVTPELVEDRGQRFGRIGIGVREDRTAFDAMMTTVSYGPLESAWRSLTLTWETSVLTLRMMGRMVTGELSWRNISGPVTIADYAGQTARLGFEHYLRFLALISISLGILNLLPIPVLDGGHLLYYFAELVKGGPLSERAMEIGQQVGMSLLFFLMIFAFYNDINRLFSG